jgi:hypothetical protein
MGYARLFIFTVTAKFKSWAAVQTRPTFRASTLSVISLYPVPLILQDFITELAFGDEYKLCFSLRSFLRSPVTPSLTFQYSSQHFVLKHQQSMSFI